MTQRMRDDLLDALANAGPAASSAVAPLLHLLDSKPGDHGLALKVIYALGAIGAPSKAALEPLVDAVRHAPAESVNRYAEAIGRIAQALAREHDRTAIPVLREALQVAENERVEPAVLAPLRSALRDLSGTN